MPFRKVPGWVESLQNRILYEMYGPGGVAILIETYTDNRNRTVQELKHLVSLLGIPTCRPRCGAVGIYKNGTVWTPSTILHVSGDDRTALDTLVSSLEEHGDVEEVYTNAESNV